MKFLYGVLHGMQWIMFYGLPDFKSSLDSNEVVLTTLGDHDTLQSHKP